MAINISEIVASWEKDSNGLSIAPAGISWIKERYRIKVGVKCELGNGCTLGNMCTLGDECKLGRWCTLKDRCTLGNGCKLGSWCTLGDWCKLENGCTLGSWCTLGNSCTLGNECILWNGCTLGSWCRLGGRCILGAGSTLGHNAADPIDLGFVDGYRKCIANVKGIAYIGAGCRWFTLSDAIKHWENKEDRRLTRIMMQYAKAIADDKGWRHN